MRYGYWLPVFGGWLRNVEDENMQPTWDYVSRLARRSHSRLAALGPSDGGGTLLGDVARLPGRVYPVWGCDHYLNPDWDLAPLISRLLRCVSDGRAAKVPDKEGAPEVIA